MRKIAYCLVFVLLITPLKTTYASADIGDDNRYFVQSTKGFWKNTLGVRNSFESGFTAELSDWQLRIARLAGLKVYPVKKFTILPSHMEEPLPSGIGKPDQRIEPATPVPWGIQKLSSDSLLTKTSGGSGVSVAVLDTGAVVDHPDLKERVKDCKDFTFPKQSVAEGKCDDKNGHGTHVAGIVAADGGSDHRGIYGMAPEAALLVYKTCSNSGSCWADDVATAIVTATDKGAQIITMSFGADATSSLVADASAYATARGVLLVAAAGNDGPYAASVDYPAAQENIISVGAVDLKEAIADWSSRGTNSATKPYERNEGDMELAAPGVNIESTWKDGGYAIVSGTSMAAPHIAGLAARLWQRDAEKPAEATRDLLHRVTKDLIPEGDDDASGWGLPQPY